MKVVILAGGFGTRLSEETSRIPKPMVTVGGRPILWHIMKIYSHYGFNEFIICLGYKGYIIKEYFSNYLLHQSDVTFDIANNRTVIHNNSSEPWSVTLIDTGMNTMTGGRIRRIKEYVGESPFLLTYGDGVADVDINALVSFHKETDHTVTLTAVQPLGRFGAVDIGAEGNVTNFVEKPRGDDSWINGGFFVMEPDVFDYLSDDDCVLEQAPLQTLSRNRRLGAYRHRGFWKPMDTLRDRQELESMWSAGDAAWKVW